MSTIIQVTQDDIDYGSRQSATSCPIARAVKREFPTKTVHVNSATITVGDKIVKTQPVMSEFVTAYDNGGRNAVAPFKHVLDLDA